MNLDLFHGLFEGTIAIKIGEQFLVTYRVQGVQMPFGIQGFGFFQKTLFHHQINAFVDAFDEMLSVPKQGVFLDFKITLDGIAAAERGERLPRLVADFQGPLQSSWVLLVDEGEIFRIEALDFVL